MTKLVLLTGILLLSSWSITAQEPSVNPTVSPKNAEAATKLLLEIFFNPELPPGYSTVNGGVVWFTRFVALPGPQPLPKIRAVKLASKLNGDTVNVRLSLLRGEFDQEDLVGVYQVSVGEQKILNELRAVGVEPFKITLLNTIPPLPPPPAFENHTKSVEIVSVQAENMPKPAYEVIFRNLSDKDLLALRVDVKSNDRPGIMAFFQYQDGQPAIAAGGILERQMSVIAAQRTATGYAPGTAAANTIVIRSAVFADMSFEGELEPACLFESFVMARRVWFRTVLALLDEELSRPANEDQVEAARQFKEKFAALRFEFDESERNQASVVSPACPKPSGKAENSIGPLKLEVLRELDDIISTRQAPPVNFRSWLEARRADYKASLTRLK